MKSFVTRWRDTVASADGPRKPTTRHVLLTLSLYMDSEGNAYPSVRALAVRTGCSRKAVMEHVAKAEADGWLVRETADSAQGKGWRRTRYHARMPGKVVTESDHDNANNVVTEGDHETGRPLRIRGNPDDHIVVTQGDLNNPRNKPSSQHPPSHPDGDTSKPASRNGRSRRSKKGSRATWLTPYADAWKERCGGEPNYGQLAAELGKLVKRHPEADVLRAWRYYLSHTEVQYCSPSSFRTRVGYWLKESRPQFTGYT